MALCDLGVPFPYPTLEVTEILSRADDVRERILGGQAVLHGREEGSQAVGVGVAVQELAIIAL